MRRDAAFLIAIALAMPLAGASPGVYATIVKHDEADAAVWLDLTAGGAKLVYHDTGADGTLHSTANADPLFLHLGSSTTAIETNDIILSGSSAGSRVTSSHGSHGDTFATTTVTTSTEAIEALVKYRDVNGATGLNKGDSLYLDLDGDDLVSTGDIRLTAVTVGTTTYTFGSVVAAGNVDTSTSPALTSITIDFSSRVKLFDITGDGRTSDDPVYLDLDDDHLVDPSDIRWTTYRSLAAGVFPTWSDSDVVGTLTSLTASAEILKQPGTPPHYLVDLGTSGWSEGDLRLTARSTACGLGTFVKATDTCDGTTTSFETTSWEFMFLDELGGGLDSEDTLYVHFGGGSTAATGDLRLTELKATGFTTKAAGTTIAGVSDDDHGLTFSSLGLVISYFDADGTGTVSSGDAIYLDGGVPGVIDMGDVRISKIGSLSTATFVGIGDSDVEQVLRDLAAPGAGTIAYIERDGGAGFHIADPVLLRMVTATTSAIDVNDLRISAGPDGAAGTLVGAGDEEDGLAGVDTTALTLVFVDVTGGGYSVDDLIYATQGPIVGVTTAIEIEDVRVSSVTTNKGTFDKGSRVASSHGDAGDPAEVVPGKAMFQDRNGDGKLDAADRVYWNVDDDDEDTDLAGLHLITRLDVRLSGTGGTTTQGVGTSSTTSAPPASTSTTTTTTTTTTATTTGTTTTTTTTTPPITLQTIASWNLNIQDSLTIERTPDGNLLSWDEQHGPLGFQVFRSDSPFEEIVQLGAGATSYVDPEGALDSAYLVTAFYSGGLGFIADANTEDIPGLGVAPEGKTVGGKQAVPGLGIVLIAVVLAGLVVVRRRIE